MKISIIIPAYNVEKYLDECLSSCFRQDIPASAYEVIIVNDGSVDTTLQIAEQWKERHENIKVISQSNKGLSEARNMGMQSAEGDYIMFLDSDDWIADNCLGMITETCCKECLDILQIGAAKVNADSQYRLVTYPSEKTVYDGKSVLKKKFNISAPFGIYRKDFLTSHAFSFYPGIYHEDNEFTPRVFYRAERVMAINDIIYYVRHTPGSITRSVNPKRIFDLMTVVESLLNFTNTSVTGEYRQWMYFQAAHSLNWCLSEMGGLTQEQRKEAAAKLCEHKDFFRYMIKSPSILHKVEGLLMIIFPYHASTIFRHLRNIDLRKKRR